MTVCWTSIRSGMEKIGAIGRSGLGSPGILTTRRVHYSVVTRRWNLYQPWARGPFLDVVATLRDKKPLDRDIKAEIF